MRAARSARFPRDSRLIPGGHSHKHLAVPKSGRGLSLRLSSRPERPSGPGNFGSNRQASGKASPVSDFCKFMWQRKRLWLLPILTTLVLIAALLLLGDAGGLRFFEYENF